MEKVPARKEEAEEERAQVASKVTAEEVPYGSIRGNVKYPWGTVTGAKVVAGEKTVVSDNAGNYEIGGLDPGFYDVKARAPFPGYEGLPQQVEVKAGETKLVDIYLDFKKAVVEGHVYGQDGKPIVGATLSGVLSGREMDSVTTDGNGFFSFEKVTAGDRFIRVNVLGYVGETRDFTASEKETTVLEFHLTPATFKIYGTVTDSEGNPLRAEILLLKRGIAVQKTISDSQTGYYEFPAVPGMYEVQPFAEGHAPTAWSGSISVDTRADFSLRPAPKFQPE